MLWATMPSPAPRVRGIIDRLFVACALHVNSLPELAFLLPVCSLSSLSAPIPATFVYVGGGCKSFPVKPSPWLNPFAHLGCKGLKLYRKYVLARPDFLYFMNEIASASSLVCDCPATCKCHARVLIDLLPKGQLNTSFPEYEQSIHSTSMNATSDDPTDELDADTLEESICGECISDADLASLNETVRTTAVGSRPAFPQIWQDIINHVRSFEVLLFWEIFSGEAVLTECMKENGWECAMPLDILYHPDLDLLNPQFLAVVIGLVLEGRFAIIHLGPPCSSFSMAVNRFYSFLTNS